MAGAPFGVHLLESLLSERFEFVLRDRLSVGLGDSLPSKIREFLLCQLAVFIGVGCREEGVEVSVRLTQPESSRAPQAAASTSRGSHRASLTRSVEGERSASREAVTSNSPRSVTESREPLMSGVPTETMMARPVMRESAPPEAVTGKPGSAESAVLKSASSKSMPRETGMSEITMTASAVTGESLAASPAAPAVMPRSGMTSMAGPTVSRKTAATSAARCPTAPSAVTGPTGLMAAAFRFVTNKLEVAIVAEPFTAGPVATRSSSFTESLTKPTATLAAPRERGSGGWSAVAFRHPGAAAKASVRTSTRPVIAGIAVRTTSLRANSLRSAPSRTRLPGDLPIRAPIKSWAAIVRHLTIVAHRAAIATLAPIAASSGTLVSRVPPLGLLSVVALWATAGKPPLGRPEVPALFVRSHAAFFVSLIVTPTVILAVFTPLAATHLVGRPRGTMATGHGPTLVGPTFADTRARGIGLIIGIAPYFVARFSRLDRVHCIDSPLALCDVLQRRRCRNASQKHQRAITHRQFLDTHRMQADSPIRRGHRIARINPHPRPMDVSRPRLITTIVGQP
jgi:hypothetical protein